MDVIIPPTSAPFHSITAGEISHSIASATDTGMSILDAVLVSVPAAVSLTQTCSVSLSIRVVKLSSTGCRSATSLDMYLHAATRDCDRNVKIVRVVAASCLWFAADLFYIGHIWGAS